MPESNQNDDKAGEEVSTIDAVASVANGCQAVFWMFVAVFLVGMLIYLLFDTAIEKKKARQRSKAVQESVQESVQEKAENDR